MKFAINLPLMGALAEPGVGVEFARLAEQAGWDGFFPWDHISYSGLPVADPWIILSAAAVLTEKIKLGAMVTPLPRRRPWKVARETVSLDRLSNGRLIFGAGIGGGGDEWAELGETTDEKRRAEMLDEALDLLAELWQGQAIHHEGQHYTARQKSFLPVPLQTPRIPVWIAGMWPGTKPFQRAARWDGVFAISRKAALGGMISVDEVKALVAYVTAQRPDHLREQPFDVVVGGKSSGDAAQARATVAPYSEAGVTWWLEDLSPWAYGWKWGDPLWSLEPMRERLLAGPPRL